MYEYKVVPAPVRAVKAKGLKTTAERFSHALAERINAEAAGGWQFQRTESLACEERSNLGRVKTSVQTVMVFSRLLGEVRPDAGAALAAAQVAQSEYYVDASAYADEPVYDEPRHEHPEHDAPQYEAPAYDYDETPQPDDREPEPAPQPRAPSNRQEPLFRANPIPRHEGAGRTEPTLRPRTPRNDDA